MAKLIVRENGKALWTLELDPNKDYMIGRSRKSDVILKDLPKISRIHLKLQFTDGFWEAQLLSDFKNLIVNNKLELSYKFEKDGSFKIESYSFNILYSEASNEVKSDPVEEFKDINLEKSSANLSKEIRLEQPKNSEELKAARELTSESKVIATGSMLLDGETQVLKTSNIGFRVTKTEFNLKEIFLIKENSFNVGRDNSCDITVNLKKIGRKHFEVSQLNDFFVITDLGSKNPTFLNEKPIEKTKSTRIESGDMIKVCDVTFKFEIVDINLVSAKSQNVNNKLDSYNFSPSTFDKNVIRLKNLEIKDKSKKIHRKVNFAVLGSALIVLGIAISPLKNYLGLSPAPDKISTEEAALASIDPELAKLSPEQRELVQSKLELAEKYHSQGKYLKCQYELTSLHSLIANYKDSQELESQCLELEAMIKQNSAQKERKLKAEQAEKEAKAIAQKCEEKAEKLSADEINRCLQEVSNYDANVFNEYSYLIENARAKAKAEKEKKERLRRQREAFRKSARTGESIYQKAKDLYVREKYRSAIEAYEIFLATKYEDPKNYKNLAKEEMENALSVLTESIQSNFDKCQQFYNEQNLKQAFHACSKALSYDYVKEVDDFQKNLLSELRTKMKVLFSEAIVAESYGNIELAKKLWKEILEKNIAQDEYSIKSTLKLKKYGIGI